MKRCAGLESRAQAQQVTPLWVAASQGEADAVRSLANGKADVDTTAVDVSSALHVAAINGHHEVCARLLEAGGPTDARDGSGRTAEAWALRRGWHSPEGSLGGPHRHGPTLHKVQRQCCRLLRLIGRLSLLGPEQLRRAMSLAIAGVIGFYGRSTPIPYATCAAIEAVRTETLRRRGICPSEPRIIAFAPPEAGGLGHEHDF